MKRTVLNLLKSRYVPRCLRVYIFSGKYLKENGWFKSWDVHKPINNESKPLPWFTYPFIHFLEPRLDPKTMRVFEFGSGNSTLWFSPKVKSLISVEDDKNFYASMRDKISATGNVSYELRNLNDNYHQMILDFKNEFDIIIIDGKERVECAKNCLQALNENGVIIFDNSDRSDYNEAYDFLSANGFKKIDFRGPGPLVYAAWQTSVYYRNKNCLNI